jgi:sortase (surface protein transpeptidase)
VTGAAALAAVVILGLVLAAAGCSSDSRTAPAPTVSTASGAPSPAAPAPLTTSAPVRVQIPAIGVDSFLMDLGLMPDRTLQVPPRGFPAGWYTGSPTPGALGPAIIAGHVDWDGQPGVFHQLRTLRPGEEVTVARQDGSTALFRVTQVNEYPKSDFPTGQVYGDIDHAGLRLITCGGPFDREARSYDNNIVVFADLVGSGP